MRKGFAPILLLLGIVVVVAIAGGIYFFATTKSSTQPENQPITSQKDLSTPFYSPQLNNTFNSPRAQALSFIKSNSNIYDKVWEWEGFSYQNYTTLPNKNELNYQWFVDNESKESKDVNGNITVTWVGLPGCKKVNNVYKYEDGSTCYSLDGFTVYFDNNSSPTNIKVIDVGGVQ